MTLRNAVVLVCAVVLLAGCASTKATDVTPMVAGSLPRPNQIWVYDFVAAPQDMPSNSSIAGQVGAPSTPATPEQIETGRKYGKLIAQQLVQDIQAMGMPAIEASPGSSPQVGDAVIRGYLISTEGGGTGGIARRFVVGFGAGTAEMDTVVEGFAVTPNGWRKMGSGTLTASGSKMPGMVAPAAVAIATGNPIGLIVMGGVKIYGETSGRNTLEGRSKATADAIADLLKVRFQDRGWIAQS